VGCGIMQNVFQQNIQEIAIKMAIEREELLIKKYSNYKEDIKDKNIKDILIDFETTAREHIKSLQDKMEKLNPRGSLSR